MNKTDMIKMLKAILGTVKLNEWLEETIISLSENAKLWKKRTA